MIYSELLSTVLRGLWFISFRDLESNFVIIDKLLSRDADLFKPDILSDTVPFPHLYMSDVSAKSASSGGFSEAPKDSVAIIPLTGTMIKNSTMCAYGTSEVAQVIREAADCVNISGIVLQCDSGGGAVDAIAPVISALDYLRAAGKSSVAHVDMCASACYYAACYCDEIIASNNISAEIGSIGVLMSFRDYSKYYADQGIKEHTVYSDLSDYKNAPYEAAKKGDYKLIKEEMLNPLAKNFQEAVKKRRCKLDQSVDGILSGRMFFAEDALKNGLIDAIGDTSFALNRVKELRRDACVSDYINSKN